MGERGEEIGYRLARIISEEASAVVDVPHHRPPVACAYKHVLAVCEVPVVGVVALHVEYLVGDPCDILALSGFHKRNLVGGEI